MKTDPSQGPKGSEIIKILPHISVVDDDHPFTKSEYAAFREHILDKLERLGLTDLRKHIVTEELWVPETIEEMYYSNHGAIYGVVSDKKLNKGFKTPKKSKLYNNLYFVGGSVNPGGGMPMVILSGQQVVEQVLKQKRYQ
jgi:diapolycopene oxygenase